MRFRRGKEDGNGSSADAAPPPAAAERVEAPTVVQPTKESEQPGSEADQPAKVLPPTDGADGGPQSPAPAAGPQSPPPAEAAGADATPTSGNERVDPAAPTIDSPPPSAGDRLDAPPPSPGQRVDGPAGTAIAAPPPQPGQLVAAAPPSGPIACPQCGSPAEPGQEMCIVCGSRIAPPPGTQRSWRLPAALAGLGVLLIGTAIAFAVVELTQDDEVKKNDVADLAPEPNPAPPAATPAPTTPPIDQAPQTIPPATRENPPGDPNAQPDEPTPTPAPDTGGSIAEWPAGKTAYTVVLVSATSRNAADAKAEQAIKRGIKAGVLRSDDFSSLRAGYWVVFAGQYDTSEQATRAADRYAEQGFGGGYPRQVKPK